MPQSPKPMPLVTFDPVAQNPLEAKPCQELSNHELAQVLAARLSLTDDRWHQKKGDRAIRAPEQAAAALVYLLNEAHPDKKAAQAEALDHLKQAAGWLDRSLKAPRCPDHGH
ncbi:MAG: DUF6439 family protein [Cyanophyceae cyanobacterium]